MKHFTVAEFCRSKTADKHGISNKCKMEHVENITALVDNVLDPLRDWYGKPITVTSGFRTPALNAVLPGASKTSQHMSGEAADISVFSRDENKKLFNYIRFNLPYDQLINEKDYSWVHVSFKKDGYNRFEVLNL